MKIGVLGGTFDPVHNGHLAVVEEAKKALDLDEVLLIPAAQSPFKTDVEMADAVNRVEMLCVAVKDRPYCQVSPIEIDREGVSYTIDTLAELRARMEPETELYFIMGWDNLVSLPKWRSPARLLQICRVAAVPRPGTGKPDLSELEKSLPGITERVVMLERPVVDLSSSGIRLKLAQGESIHGMVPDEVERYIIGHRLYKGS